MTHLNYISHAIEPSVCISEAWELVKRRIWLYIGAGLIMLIAPNVVPYVGFLLNAPLVGGLAYVVLQDIDGDPADFSMLFKGFQKIIPLLIIGLVQAVPAFGIVGLTMIANLLGVSSFPSRSDVITQDPTTGALSFGLTVGMVMWVIGYAAFSIIWNWALTFAIPLIIEHDLGIGDAIRLSFGATFSNIGGLFVLGLWGFLVALLGVLALVVGIFVAFPVIMAANVIAYRQVFPRFDETPIAPHSTYTSIFGNEE